jgi:hypothetical protein
MFKKDYPVPHRSFQVCIKPYRYKAADGMTGIRLVAISEAAYA